MDPLEEGLFAEVWCYGAHLHAAGADEAVPRPLVPVYRAQTRAEVAVFQVGVGGGAFL